MTNREAFAVFIRARRAALQPCDVGLQAGPRRRAVGLRREEVAQLAGLSWDYYTRLEQGRAAAPSDAALAALAIALRCDDYARDTMFAFAGVTPTAELRRRHIPPTVMAMCDGLADIPVQVRTDVNNIIHQNVLADAALSPTDRHAPSDRNATWLWFTDPQTRRRLAEDDWEGVSRSHIDQLRNVVARRPTDEDVSSLLRRLTRSSAEFRRRWHRRTSATSSDGGVQRIIIPDVGTLQVRQETTEFPEAHLRVVAFIPAQGTDARDKLDFLRVIGSQRLGDL